MPRRSRAAVERTRTAILDHATAVGSVEGLEALTIGRLADDLGLSKSGVFGHFGSKESLQLAALEAGNARFRDEVWEPVAGEPPGLPRLRALMDSWLSYLDREVFPGGCFLTAAAIEFDDRPGPVRDRISETWALWLRVLEREVVTAQEAGDLDRDLDAGQLAFQLNAYVMAGNSAKQLFGDATALAASRAAVDTLLLSRSARSSAR